MYKLFQSVYLPYFFEVTHHYAGTNTGLSQKTFLIVGTRLLHAYSYCHWFILSCICCVQLAVRQFVTPNLHYFDMDKSNQSSLKSRPDIVLFQHVKSQSIVTYQTTHSVGKSVMAGCCK